MIPEGGKILGSIDKMIQWFRDREGKVTYSMTNRLGPNSYDCSSSVYFSLIAGGFLPAGSMGNTESLYGLEGRLLQPITRGAVRRGDIFVSGIKGSSGGSDGHTGIFLDNQTIIHATKSEAYGINGIVTTKAQGWMGDYSGLPVYYYRITNTDEEEKSTNKGARAMFVYIKKMKNGSGQYWGVNGTNRFYFGTIAEVDHYKKIVKGNGGDTTVNTWEEGSVQMKVVEMMAPTVTTL